MYFSYDAAYNPLKPGETYVHALNGLSLVQIMAYHLFGTKPLSELVLIYCQFDL